MWKMGFSRASNFNYYFQFKDLNFEKVETGNKTSVLIYAFITHNLCQNKFYAYLTFLKDIL